MNITCIFVFLYLIISNLNKSCCNGLKENTSKYGVLIGKHLSFGKLGRKQKIFADTIEFTYFTKENKHGKIFKATATPLPVLKDLNADIPVKIITHETTGNCATPSEMCRSIAMKYLNLDEHVYQVITVDYSVLATPLEYLTLARHAWRIAEVIAFVVDEVLDKGVKPKDIHLIGYGLGAHICGYTGHLVNRGLEVDKIGRITGLDPTLLFFEVSTDGLQTDQAMFVDIVHTSVDVIGIPDARGHADFYPNAGIVPQPHCEHNFEGTYGECSHKASWHWFHKSIGTTKIKAYRCSSFTRFTFFTCSGIKEMIFGDNTPRNAIGVFYFNGDFR